MIFPKKLIESQNHFDNLYKVCGNKFLQNCGSYLINGITYDYYIDHYPKQKLLFDLIKKEKKFEYSRNWHIHGTFFNVNAYSK